MILKTAFLNIMFVSISHDSTIEKIRKIHKINNNACIAMKTAIQRLSQKGLLSQRV